jgi:hypothetical protein
MDKAQELMEKIDVDKSGEIDFEEYCRWVCYMFDTVLASVSWFDLLCRNV